MPAFGSAFSIQELARIREDAKGTFFGNPEEAAARAFHNLVVLNQKIPTEQRLEICFEKILRLKLWHFNDKVNVDLHLGIRASFEKLLSESDIISIHCPLTPKTNHLFNKKAFDKIKKGVMIINTSRGAIIHSEDAISALKNEQIGYLGIDVYENEVNLFFKDHSQSIIQDDIFERLLTFHNVLITPHQAFYTQEAVTEITKITLKNFTDFEENKALENEVKF